MKYRIFCLGLLLNVSALLGLAQDAPFSQEPARTVLFDQFSTNFRNECDIKARLDNLAAWLEKFPNNKGLMVYYIFSNTSIHRSNVINVPWQKATARYLPFSRGVAPDRFSIEFGGYLEPTRTLEKFEEGLVYLWLVPEGNPPPEKLPAAKELNFHGKTFNYGTVYLQLPEDYYVPQPSTPDDEAERNEPDIEETPDTPEQETVVAAAENSETKAAQEDEEEDCWDCQPTETLLLRSWANKPLTEWAQKEHSSRIHIIYYADASEVIVTKLHQHFEQGREYLREKFGIAPERVSFVFGGYRQHSPIADIWFVKKGDVLPTPAPEPLPDDSSNKTPQE